MENEATIVKNYIRKLLSDPYRPTFHFASPDANNVFPGDPNGAFYADGVYHLMYLYRNLETDRDHWGHITSTDLLHWRLHKDAITGIEGTKGCFSGGAFVDDDGTAYLAYWQLATRKEPIVCKGGIYLASARPPYEDWTLIEPPILEQTVHGITDIVLDGETVHIGCSDPSNIWKENGYYYMELGALLVLRNYGRTENSPRRYRGGWTELLRSGDLKTWEYVHRFYDNTLTGDDWPDETEDDMCPSFLPLYDKKSGGKPTGKWLQLFISHNKGCQYFIGTVENETFRPESHGRMTWRDKTFFAPEALIDGKGRQIMWAWLVEEPLDHLKEYGWNGIYSFPRVLWLEGNELKMAPAEELQNLQTDHRVPEYSQDGALDVPDGTSFRIKAKWKHEDAEHERCGFSVRVSADGAEHTDIYYDAQAGKLVVDATKSGSTGRTIKEEAPFALKEGETLELDIFVDRSVVEVYANERQAVCRCVYPTDPTHSVGVKLIGEKPRRADAWSLSPANAY